MLVELFPFQKQALADLRMKSAEALGAYRRTHAPQVVSFTAPTGSGKTIIMASLMESIFFGDGSYPDQPEAIFVWLSDSPQLNEQSKDKIDGKADKIPLSRCVTVSDSSFDQELFDDGHIYFLNTQKLSKTSNLTGQGDGRTTTIWETLANTAREKSDRLYIIIDEAHRGMQGREAGKATTIMQKFLKGSEEDNLPPMPVVIGMSATPARFDRLAAGTTSTVHKVVVEARDVRASGLLKDRIVITYPEENTVHKDMAVLQAAADDWKQKWDRWGQYCTEQHYAQVYPVLVIQVQNGTGDRLSDTDLDDCLQKIEERIGKRFEPGQVVHAFGQTSGAVTINGLTVPYEEPSQIAGNRQIRLVFFKESLSTGWDCPRAETMMSFRHASDSTYIAQLLGRMVRTPMQMHIQVDDVLNDVHLYLPHFDETTVKEVVEALQNAEGGDIPTDIDSESLGKRKFSTLTVNRKKHKPQMPPGTPGLFDETDARPSEPRGGAMPNHMQSPLRTPTPATPPASTDAATQEKEEPAVPTQDNTSSSNETTETTPPQQTEIEFPRQEDLFDREAVMRYINDAGLLSYNVRKVQISNYLASLLGLAHLLTNSSLYPTAIRDIRDGATDIIRKYVDELKAKGEYEDAVNLVKQFKLSTQIFDVFGESVDNYAVHDLFTTTDTDIDRQFRLAEGKLENEGLGVHYGKKYAEESDIEAFKVDVILFAASDECMNHLHAWAKDKYHKLNDEYRRRFAAVKDEQIRKEYDSIVSNGDIISKHNFRLPETIQIPQEDGKEYRDHLFVDDETGVAKIKLNSWEDGVLAEEQARDDFVCWIRNPSRGSWALCIPYEMDSVWQSTYPDLLIVRKDVGNEYVIDILEPHRANEKDNLGKAKGFAEYARQNPGVGRIQLIRQSKDMAGKSKFRRLDMSQSSVREKVSRCATNDELDHLFETDGFFI